MYSQQRLIFLHLQLNVLETSNIFFLHVLTEIEELHYECIGVSYSCCCSETNTSESDKKISLQTLHSQCSLEDHLSTPPNGELHAGC